VVKRTCILMALLTSSLFLLSGCSHLVQVEEILQNPDKYDGQNIILEGSTDGTGIQVSSLNKSAYQILGTTGVKIWVVTSGEPPKKCETIRLKGTVTKNVTLGTLVLEPALIERSRRTIYQYPLPSSTPLSTTNSTTLTTISPTPIQQIQIPEGVPLITAELDYRMRGEIDSLYIYEDGSVIYIEEKGLRLPTPGNPATRTWKTGKLLGEELNSLMEFINNSGFNKLNEYYRFPGKPEGSGMTYSDGDFDFYFSYGGLQKKVTAVGYLTPDHGKAYPDMPYPLNELYVKLRDIALNHTDEVLKEDIQ
jgi:hypothetical protein